MAITDPVDRVEVNREEMLPELFVSEFAYIEPILPTVLTMLPQLNVECVAKAVFTEDVLPPDRDDIDNAAILPTALVIVDRDKLATLKVELVKVEANRDPVMLDAAPVIVDAERNVVDNEPLDNDKTVSVEKLPNVEFNDPAVTVEVLSEVMLPVAQVRVEL